MRSSAKRKKVRYAVVGLGYIAQAAVLPAVAFARSCEAALVFDNPTKLKEETDLLLKARRPTE